MKAKIIKTPAEFIEYRKQLSGSVGFVPTMGALHEGHERLLKQARHENGHVVLSVFVNPTQFNNADDFAKYPSTFEQDLAMAERNDVDVVFSPVSASMYPDDYRYKVSENSFSKKLCGAHRPGHFDGVLSVVMKLFNVVRPTRAYFGEKDFQQLELIRAMVDSYFMDLKIVPVPTVRASNGLALSSRNKRLTPEQLQLAPNLYRVLSTAESEAAGREELERLGFKVEYFEAFNNRRFVAAWLGDVRLIDNVQKEVL